MSPLATVAATLGAPTLLVAALAVAPAAPPFGPPPKIPGSPPPKIGAPATAALVAATREPGDVAATREPGGSEARASPLTGDGTGRSVTMAAGPLAAGGGPAAFPRAQVRVGTGFHWPVTGPPVIGRRFVVGPHPWSPGHRGVDLVVQPGRPVLAPGAGVVRFAGPVANRGVLTLDHGDGLLTSYEPVRPAVRAGQQVQAGAVIGWLGAPAGHCPASCLHWGARRAGRYLDPLSLLAGAPGPAILLPLR